MLFKDSDWLLQQISANQNHYLNLLRYFIGDLFIIGLFNIFQRQLILQTYLKVCYMGPTCLHVQPVSMYQCVRAITTEPACYTWLYGT